MRYAFAVVALWMVTGCASPTAIQEAVNRCAAVGISPRDADFTACTEAYRLERQQTAISNAYRNTSDMQPRRRRAVE
jgi:uncharacterized lipoprotein YajG